MAQDKASHQGFNYCFWAKLMVAIPAIPLVAVMAASAFSDPITQIIAAGAGVSATIYLAIKIDRIPALMCKVRRPK